ncbi:MAG: dihydrodipicolinate synthase family protein, partial [Proteobacteria bacterium]|nr:dihydrodipicolinate synthase family protein [Pseudomonadota bacterium]
MRLSGSITALATPFDASGEIDLDAWHQLLALQLDGRTEGIVVAGSTGEAAALYDAEYDTLLRSAVELVAGRIPVLAGTGQSNTAKTIEQTRRAAALGADAALVVTPPYVRPPQAGLVAHYRAVADDMALPVVLYNVPGRTGGDLLPDVYDDWVLVERDRLEVERQQPGVDRRQLEEVVDQAGEAVGLSAHGAVVAGHSLGIVHDAVLVLEDAPSLAPGAPGIARAYVLMPDELPRSLGEDDVFVLLANDRSVGRARLLDVLEDPTPQPLADHGRHLDLRHRITLHQPGDEERGQRRCRKQQEDQREIPDAAIALGLVVDDLFAHGRRGDQRAVAGDRLRGRIRHHGRRHHRLALHR